MIVGTLTVKLSLGDLFSLKEKRQIVKSVIDKVKNKFNVSIAEVDQQDVKRWAVIGIACVSNNTQFVCRKQNEQILVLSAHLKSGYCKFSFEYIHDLCDYR